MRAVVIMKTTAVIIIIVIGTTSVEIAPVLSIVIETPAIGKNCTFQSSLEVRLSFCFVNLNVMFFI